MRKLIKLKSINIEVFYAKKISIEKRWKTGKTTYIRQYQL